MTDEDDKDEVKKGQAHIDTLLGEIHHTPRHTGQKAVFNSGSLQLMAEKVPDVVYNHALVADFLHTVFHSEFDHDEHIPCFFDVNRQGYPISEEALIAKLRETHEGAKLYFGTSTITPQPDDGRLLNRNASFKRYHIIVLDDIGTKIPLEKIPAALRCPTTIVETSKGNFQYGYVFKKPLTCIKQARCLLDLVHEAGITDTGGKLVTKKVRLPEGIHGKTGSVDYGFRTKLVTMHGPLWSPEEILEAIETATTWPEVVENAEKVRSELKCTGTSLWSPINAHHESLSGIIDPVLEWLQNNNMVLGTNWDNGWVTIVCPKCLNHSEPDQQEAGYSPIGCGSEPFKRAFNCFHHSCTSYNTVHFLDHVLTNGGPSVPVIDHAASLVANHVFDSGSGRVWRIGGSTFVYPYHSLEAFKMTHHKIVRYRTYSKTTDKATWGTSTEGRMWCTSQARVTVDGTTYDPRTSARMVKHDGHVLLNEFALPDYGAGPYDQRHVDMFTEFLAYLLPIPEQREVFTLWIAAKLQDMSFRGWGMLMIAKCFRTGRGTLQSILTSLFHSKNCASVPFSELVSADQPFNEWQARALVFTAESRDSSEKSDFYKSYTRLKEVIDTTVNQVTINNKYGARDTDRLCFTSHLIASNHEMAAGIDKEDKRLYVMENPLVPAPPAYFTRLRAWMQEVDSEGSPLFINHVARWLQTIEVDYQRLNSPAEMTESKRNLIEAIRSPLDVAVDAFFGALPTPFMHYNMLEDVLHRYSARLRFDKMRDYQRVLRTVVSERTFGMYKNVTIREKNSTMRPRVSLISKHDTPAIKALRADGGSIAMRKRVGTDIYETRLEPLSQAVDYALKLEGL